MEKRVSHLPKVFRVNWFRQSLDGQWLWPGFGDNSRVHKWMCERVEGKVGAVPTPIGNMPRAGDLDLTGLAISEAKMQELLRVDSQAFESELKQLQEYMKDVGDRLPARMVAQLNAYCARITQAAEAQRVEANKLAGNVSGTFAPSSEADAKKPEPSEEGASLPTPELA